MNIGTVRISEALLLDWLQFQGGSIRLIAISATVPGLIEVQICHPEMPEVALGQAIPEVTPQYIRKYSKTGRVLKVTRQPLKGA